MKQMQLMKVGDVARFFGVSTSAVRRWCSEEMIVFSLFPSPTGVHRHRRFRLEDVESFAEANNLKILDNGPWLNRFRQKDSAA